MLIKQKLSNIALPSSWGGWCWGRWEAWWSTRRGWTPPPATACTWSCPSPSACTSPAGAPGWRSRYTPEIFLRLIYIFLDSVSICYAPSGSCLSRRPAAPPRPALGRWWWWEPRRCWRRRRGRRWRRRCRRWTSRCGREEWGRGPCQWRPSSAGERCSGRNMRCKINLSMVIYTRYIYCSYLLTQI